MTMLRRPSLIPLLLLLFPSASLAQDLARPFQITPYTQLRIFNWKEFDDVGTQLLEESGPQFAIGAIPRVALAQQGKLFLDADVALYFGKVDYNGALQDGTPYRTSTSYFGFEISPAIGYVFSLSKQFDLTPSAGFGFEHWSRGINSGEPPGYTEKYNAFLFQLGANGTVTVARDIQLFAGMGIKIPLSISESVEDLLNLSPGISPRLRFSGGAVLHRVLLELSFETWKLTRSADVPIQGVPYHQPDSTRKVFGIRVGYTL